ncbi:hypothetical protein [Robertmurraya massiliosenegalensis]|nr:hypothetical protein [Robertmurraya massiliosenegalensis]
MKKKRFKRDDFEDDMNDEFYFIAGYTDGVQHLDFDGKKLSRKS